MDKSKWKIKANLLYRLSRDGPEISTFHKLCDNKGATLTLIHVKNIEDKIGFFVNSSFDSVSEWKQDENSFLFNLNKNKKYQKIPMVQVNLLLIVKKYAVHQQMV